MKVRIDRARATAARGESAMSKSRAASALLLALAASGASHAQPPVVESTAQSLAGRIAHTDPAAYHHSPAVHGGAGTMDFGTLLGARALDTNLIFLHRGVIHPHSGIGAHFHNECEEMYVILDGEAQFTIDGRTALLRGPAGAPTRAGHSHGIYNATDRPVQWLNINVGMTKAYDTFNLDDPRVGVAVDAIPTFMTLRLDRALLRPVERMKGGAGTALYRRALGPSVFATAWSYVDHLLLPPGASLGRSSEADMSEFYYVLAGEGTVTIGAETARIRAGDAIPVRLGEAKAFANDSSAPLEFLIVGVARDLAAKRAFSAIANPPRGN
jgi:mannose-6-phosphate isomerase-like protein (cupin superfamily)